MASRSDQNATENDGAYFITPDGKLLPNHPSLITSIEDSDLNRETDEDRFVGLDRSKFIEEYRLREKDATGRFISVINIVVILQWISIIVSVIIAIILLFNGFILYIVGLIGGAVNAYIILSISEAAKELFALRYQNLRNESINIERDQKEAMKMNDALLKSLEENAAKIKTGNNSIVVVGSNNSSISNSIEIKNDIRDDMAMLIAFANSTKNRDVVDAAERIAIEASKEYPDKSNVFSLWNKIVSLAPAVSDVATITKAVMKMLGH